jgi:hypothetical protein
MCAFNLQSSNILTPKLFQMFKKCLWKACGYPGDNVIKHLFLSSLTRPNIKLEYLSPSNIFSLSNIWW